MKKVGYWYSEREWDLPMPVESDFDDPAVVEYLKNGEEHAAYRGISCCRICMKANGSTCLTDGVYQWPYGLAHYVEDHGVELPKEFLEHINEKKNQRTSG